MHAFAVADDILSQIAAHGGQRGFNGREIRAGHPARRNRHHGVDVLVSLSTEMQLKERSTARASMARKASRGTARSVRMYTSMVARLGSDHARSLGDADHAPAGKRDAADFRKKIRGHDPLGGRQDRLVPQGRHRPGKRGQDLVGRKLPADHAGRTRQDFPRALAQQARRLRAHALRGLHAAGRADVRDLIVHQDRAQRRLGQAPATDHNRCAGKALRVNTAAKIRRGPVEHDQRQRHLRGLGHFARVNAKRVVPTRKPAGNRACVASQARWTEREVKALAELARFDKWGGVAPV